MISRKIAGSLFGMLFFMMAVFLTKSQEFSVCAAPQSACETDQIWARLYKLEAIIYENFYWHNQLYMKRESWGLSDEEANKERGKHIAKLEEMRHHLPELKKRILAAGIKDQAIMKKFDAVLSLYNWEYVCPEETECGQPGPGWGSGQQLDIYFFKQ